MCHYLCHLSTEFLWELEKEWISLDPGWSSKKKRQKKISFGEMGGCLPTQGTGRIGAFESRNNEYGFAF
jgi:hypothetical protein